MGLGAGTMAAHFDRNDELVFYELDPDNERIAREHFRYLESCPANVRVAVGDGRLSLASDPLVDGHHYDALVIDAFSGDGIPIHLITVEAIETYLKTLKPNGLLAFHISNRYYDLRPILYAASRELGLSGRVRDSRGSAVRSRHERPSIVYVLATHDDALENLDPAEWLDPTRDLDLRDTRLWTDDYANMLVPLFAKLRSKFRVEAIPDLDRENERVERDARLSPDRDHSGA
jgi:spermidine synthase